jgi:hypothetical protein
VAPALLDEAIGMAVLLQMATSDDDDAAAAAAATLATCQWHA